MGLFTTSLFSTTPFSASSLFHCTGTLVDGIGRGEISMAIEHEASTSTTPKMAYRNGLIIGIMAESEATRVVPSSELLEWPKKDKLGFLNIMSRVGDLVRTIKFYTEGFVMKLLRKRDIPEEKNTNAFLGFGPEESQVSLRVMYGCPIVYPAVENEVFFKIKWSTQLKKLMSAYCDRQSVDINSISFLFDGCHLRGKQSPDDLEMENRDEINAMLHQIGGTPF
ncbi:hypothetical protein AgCh_001682 [Apium graveolens]